MSSAVLMVEMSLTGTLVSHREKMRCVFIVCSLVEAARVCAGLRLIRLEDYGNNRLPLTDCWVPSQPTGWVGGLRTLITVLQWAIFHTVT